jgi:hypothetical protein
MVGAFAGWAAILAILFDSVPYLAFTLLAEYTLFSL